MHGAETDRHRRRGRFSLWAAVALSVTTGCVAAETLGEALQLALGSDASLEAAHSRVEAAGAALEAARAERLPRLTANSTLTRWRDAPAFDFAAAGVPAVLPLFRGDSFVLTTAQLSVPIYTAGGIGASIEAADAGVAAQAQAAEALAEDIKLAVAASYIAVLRSESALEAARSNTASLSAHAHDVEDMQRSGQVPRNDLLAAMVSLADAEQRESQAENALELARSAYNRQTGRPLGAPVALDAEPSALAEGVLSEPLESLIQTALATRAELVGLTATAAELDARSSATRAKTRPQLKATGGYTAIENEFLDREDFWSLGVGITWSPFDGGRTRHEAAVLSRQAVAATQERAHRTSMIELEVRSAWLDSREARQRVGVTQRAMQQAEENLRVVEDRYLNGEGTNTEVLAAEALRSLSRSNFDNARYDTALARFRLARAVGSL
jgi:outer membrane protein